jgi:hypothetical protein
MVYVRGIIIPVSWDDRGDVADLGIETFDEDLYLIDGRDDMTRLRGLLRSEVEIGGVVRRTSGRKIIRVKAVRVL